jgi:hypothetical protein
LNADFYEVTAFMQLLWVNMKIDTSHCMEGKDSIWLRPECNGDY